MVGVDSVFVHNERFHYKLKITIKIKIKIPNQNLKIRSKFLSCLVVYFSSVLNGTAINLKTYSL